MNKLSNLSVLALVAIAAAGPAFAATPKFTNGAPGTAMSVDDFASQLGSFNAKDVTDLLDAKSVTVYNYNTAWTDKAGKAVNLLTDDSQSIGLLREALNKNPAAVKLLAENKIKVDQVVDITNIGGNVQLYIQ
ncbi:MULTISPECIES: hypothetical protein [unclassified Devosia]|jgi:hypothetical protein|uniref:hypothetical protein n=1 Tax=unclassified Devosia TaxID=196773 RepID=UPI000868AE88|nr:MULTISPECIES: hypothetical protein [unclassified Devosia]MBN9362718.1 hypothetical protein [Devosia sp.]ODS84750.1 MAG: hypothetical protein ABS47_18665 [Devosia sp. SCN 66-27]OJX23898.1 MAG: hypothetical protein BGO83_03320 [Devosia sp. 66-14]